MVTLEELANARAKYFEKENALANEWAIKKVPELEAGLTMAASSGNSVFTINAGHERRARALAKLTEHLNPQILPNKLEVMYKW